MKENGNFYEEYHSGEANPPIRQGETFNAQESLAEIKSDSNLSAEERRLRLEEFEQKLIYQREGLAGIQARIMEAIEKNPNVSSGALVEVVRDFGGWYGLTEEQRDVIKSFVGTYTEKNSLVRGLREKEPDDKKLFETLFGRLPKGEVKIIPGPMTFYVRCHDLNDYAYLCSGAYLDNREPSPEEILDADKSAGASLFRSKVVGLEGSIMIEKVERNISDSESNNTRIHEQQHAVNKLFRRKVQIEELKQTLQECGLKIYKDSPEKEQAIRDYFLFWSKNSAEETGKDEIIAYFKDGVNSAKSILIFLQKADSYDFIANIDKSIREDFGAFFESEDLKLITQIAKEIKERYHQLLEQGVEAFEQLRLNHSIEETIALLIHQPLSQWSKVADRHKDVDFKHPLKPSTK
jgi:hypothetical protein